MPQREIADIFVSMFSPPSNLGSFDFKQQARIVSYALNSLLMEAMEHSHKNRSFVQRHGRAGSYASVGEDYSDLVEVIDEPPHSDIVQLLDEPSLPVQAAPGSEERREELKNVIRIAFGRKENAIDAIVPGLRVAEDDIKFKVPGIEDKVVAHLAPLLEELECHPQMRNANPDTVERTLWTFSKAAGTISNGTKIGGIGPGNQRYLEAVLKDATMRTEPGR